MMNIKITLSRKLLLLWVMSLVVVLASVAALFYVMLSRSHEKAAQEQLQNSFTTFNHELTARLDAMKARATIWAVRDDVVSLANLISLYQDKANYDVQAFDAEKIKLAVKLYQSQHDFRALGVYDRDGYLIAAHAHSPDDHEYISVLSYFQGQPVLSISDSDEGIFRPSEDDLEHIIKIGPVAVPDNLRLELIEADGGIRIDVHVPIERKHANGQQTRVGMVTISDDLTQFVARDMSGLTGQSLQLYSRAQMRQLLLHAHDPASVEDELDEFIASGTDLWIASPSQYINIFPLKLDSGPEAYLMITADRKELGTQMLTFRNSALWILLAVAVLLVPLGVVFIRTSISKPIHGLLDGVQALSDGNFQALKGVDSQDELGSLARSFEHMAHEVHIREQRLADILGLAPEGIIATDAAMHITLFNSGAERIFGYAAKDVIGKSLNRLIPQRFHERHVAQVQAFDASNEPYRMMGGRSEITGLKSTGEEFSADASISQLWVDGEKIYTVMIQDITARKMADKELMTAKLDAEMANESKSQFLAAMSHELRTPLNAILGMSAMMKAGYFGVLNPKHAEYVGDIHHSGQHLLTLVNEILDMSTMEAGTRHLNKLPLSVTQVVDDCLKIVKVQADVKEIHLENTIPLVISDVFADQTALSKVLLNLLSNAIKFTPEGGKVEVLASENDDYVILTVKDNGVGMPTDKIPELMKPFMRHENNAYKAVEGWGLGLAITKSLMDLHGGTITIQSVVGEGTIVTVSFPK